MRHRFRGRFARLVLGAHLAGTFVVSVTDCGPTPVPEPTTTPTVAPPTPPKEVVLTVQQAAHALQAGLARWFEPAKSCQE